MKSYLIEGTMTNIFIKGDTLITTPLNNSGINGFSDIFNRKDK